MRCILVLLISSVVSAETPLVEKPEAPAPPARQDYQVGPGDVLTVTVMGVPEMSRNVSVAESGKIHIPHVGVVNVASLTCSQIEAEVARTLREKQLLTSPWVQVRIADYRAQSVYIVGEVMQGGQYVIRNEMYLADLLSLGMGLADSAGSVIYLYRRKDTPPGPGEQAGSELLEAIPIDLEKLYSGERPELNMKLRGGDMVYCPERESEYFYVLGDVGRPGRFEILGHDQLLLSRAVSMAGGPLATARAGSAVIVRYNAQGAREDVAVDFSAILHGKKPDVPIKPNDVIFVPGSTLKGLGYGLLSTIPGIAQTAVMF